MPSKKLRKTHKKATKRQKRKHRTAKRKTLRRHKRMRGGDGFSYGTEIPEGATRIVTIDGVPTSVSDEEYKKYQNGTYEREL